MQVKERGILESLMNMIEELPTNSPIPQKIYSFLQENLVKVGIDISLKDEVIHCSRHQLDLSKKKKLVKVFEVFLSKGKSPVSVSTLIHQIYDESASKKSKRQQFCYSHNAVKLLSRARRLLTKTLRGDSKYENLHWFPYDPSSRTWRLYVAKDEAYSYLAASGR